MPGKLLQTIRDLERYTLLAVDGELGGVKAFYFDVETWIVRYLRVKIADRSMEKHVLISPIAIGEMNEDEKTIHIELACEQIQNSPPIDPARPLSRQDEIDYYRYYNWTPYWELSPSSGSLRSRIRLVDPSESAIPGAEQTALHSTGELKGYMVRALDGEIGHIDDFILDTQYWMIRYLQIDTADWWPGKCILINPAWIEDLRWRKQDMSIAATREGIRQALLRASSDMISRDYGTQSLSSLSFGFKDLPLL